MTRKGAITVTTLLITFVIVGVMLTSGVMIMDGFFKDASGNDPYNTTLDRAFFTDLDEASSLSTENDKTVYRLADGTFQVNDTVTDSSDKEGDLAQRGYQTLTKTGSGITFMTNVTTGLNQKLGIPVYFMVALITIVTIILSLALLSALRGSGKL